MVTIRLRRATPDDLDLLQHWYRQPHVLAATGGGDEEWDLAGDIVATEPWLETLVAEDDGRPVGFLQIIDPHLEATHYWGDVEPGQRALDIWIGESTNIGKGYGRQIMEQAFGRCFADENVWAIIIDPLLSNTNAHGFYERLGFEYVEDREFDEDLCRIYRFTRQRWQALY
ncbi:MAG: GNAT family N-acetyltransferase [Gammaproteobacteria bacterium]